jgi:hypothetical protein
MLLLILGIVCVGLGFVFHRTEAHAYAGGTAPSAFRVHAGKTYLISVPGGARTLVKRADIATPQCSYQFVGGVGAEPLTVSPYGADTNATNAVGQFVAPVSGEITIECLNWGAVFVDNADDASFDLSTALFVVGSGVLLVAVILGAGALARDGSAPRYDDEVERLVDAGPFGRYHGEVVGTDPRDVGGQFG